MCIFIIFPYTESIKKGTSESFSGIERFSEVPKLLKFQNVVCPCCGRNRVLKTHRKGTIRWDFVKDLDKTRLLQVREQHPSEKGGKSKGFTLIEEESLTLQEMLEHPNLREVAEEMIQRDWLSPRRVGK